MFPLSQELKFGPLVGVKGPRTAVLLLKRIFGQDCFEVYFQSGSHKGGQDASHAADRGKDKDSDVM
jgi:hypothetical protein